MTAAPVVLAPELCYAGGAFHRDWVVAVRGGRVAAVGPRAAVAGAGPDAVTALPGRVLLPGGVNAHNHSFQSLLRGLGDDLDFMSWRDRVLYPFSRRLDARGIEIGAAFAFAEMLRHGITTVVDFFYLQAGGNANAEAVIRAAKRVGIRLVLARAFYDWEGAPPEYRETPAEATERCRALMIRYAGDPTVTVQPAPHSLHGASPDMIRAGAEVAGAAGVPFHIHVAEYRSERETIERRHGLTPVRYLDKLGVLGPRMIGVHCVWLDEGELRLMAERGARVAYCPSANMILGDGVTRLREMRALGIPVALGTDGGCTNNRLSIFEEMRMAALLQKVTHLDGTAFTAEEAFRLGTAGGGEVLGLPLGEIAPGQLADLVALDLGHPSLHPPLRLLKNIVYALSPQAITDVWVHGAAVVRDGRLLTTDQAALLADVRALTHDWTL
ncbi:MAG: amidohydrolase [Candidatus Rokubacteria bacterium]|nr:amidohydrolase [Candidatus Rokubacteria bacterium]